MDIVCVSGGSYKSFYINCFLKLKQCDLLVFNYGIIYDFDMKEELLGTAVVTNEMMLLSKKLNSIVVAGVMVVKNGTKKKSLFVTDGENSFVTPSGLGANVRIGNHEFCVGDETMNCGRLNKIILSDKRIKLNSANMSNRKIYVFCDKFGATIVENKKMSRKFSKYSKISLQ